MGAGRVRQGQVYVEIGADPAKFFAALNRVNKRIAGLGRELSNVGAGITGAGLALAAPFVAGVAAAARFQDTLLAVQASTGATAGQLDAVRAASMQMSAALSVGPAEAAASMLELLKAGMSLDAVLGGAGEAAIQFAKVGQMDVAKAAVVMSDAMNVFGVSAAVAANTISAAADASSTSIEQMAESFSMSAAVAALANQSIGDLSTALAILANNGVKGSDAGTSIKTMLMRLMAPADEAIGALGQLGLTVRSFRNDDGSMRPMVEIIGVLTRAMEGMDQAAKDDIFRRVFGQDAIRAAAILTSVGVDGFNAMQEGMEGALTVSEKYKTVMSGLSGAAAALSAGMQRLGIVLGESVGGALLSLMPPIMGVVNGITDFVRQNAVMVGSVGRAAAIAVVFGGALTGLGLGLRVVSAGIGGLLGALSAVVSPFVMVARLAAGIAVGAATGAVGALRLAAALGTPIVASAAAAGVALSRATLAAIAFGATGAAAVSRFATIAAASAARALGPFIVWFSNARAAGRGFFDAIAVGIRAQIASFSLLRKAVSGIGGFGAALAGDIGALSAPLRRVTGDAIAMGSAFARQAAAGVADFATQATAPLRAYVASLAAAVTSTVAAGGKMVAAYATAAAAGVSAFVSKAVLELKIYAVRVGYALASTVTATAGMAAAYISQLLPATSAFVASAAANLGKYIAQVAAAAAATVANAVRIGVAWVASGMPGLMAFLAGAVGVFGSYIAAAASVVAASVASAAAAAAAWLAPAAPVIAVVAAIGLAAAGAVAFGDSIKSALSGVGDLVGTVAGYIGSGFNQAVSDGAVVFGDLYRTATTTFGGIYDALSAGDLAGAMDILWGGLVAGWLRGQEAIMGFIDPWISTVQNLFTDLGTNIAILWDQLWTALATNTIGATILGIFDNIAVGVMAVWDTLVAEIQKAWVRVQGFISGAKDTKERVAKIDNEKQARAEQRRQNMPGVNERVRRANEDGDKMRADAAARQGAMVDNANGIKAGREAENASRAAGRRAQTVAAEQSVEGKRETAGAKRKAREEAGALEQEIAQVSDMDALHELAAQFHALAASGHLSQEQLDKMRDSLGKAQERIEGQASDEATASRDAAKAGADAAGKDVQTSKAEAVGTFSAMAADRMGFGSTLQERIAKAAEETATNTRGMQPALVGQ